MREKASGSSTQDNGSTINDNKNQEEIHRVIHVLHKCEAVCIDAHRTTWLHGNGFKHAQFTTGNHENSCKQIVEWEWEQCFIDT